MISAAKWSVRPKNQCLIPRWALSPPKTLKMFSATPISSRTNSGVSCLTSPFFDNASLGTLIKRIRWLKEEGKRLVFNKTRLKRWTMIQMDKNKNPRTSKVAIQGLDKKRLRFCEIGKLEA